MRGAKRFSVKVLLLLQLLSLTSSSSDSSSQEKTHGIQREVKKTEGRLERREDPKGRKSLNLGLVIPREGGRLSQRAVLDSVQDLSVELDVNLNVLTTPEGKGMKVRETICEGLFIDQEKKNLKNPMTEQQVLSSKARKHAMKPMTPDLIINTDSQASLALNDVATVMGIPLVSVTDDDFRDYSRNDVATRERVSDLSKDSSLAGMMTNKGVVMVKSPSRLLAESVRDAVAHFGLGSNLIRVLYDKEYAPLMAKLEQMLPNGTVFEFLDEKERMDSSDFVKRMRRMRKPRVSSFVVMANTEVMANLTKVIHENDMFRSAFTWFFATKDKRKVKCVSCKHAKLNVIQPVICHLHDYEGTTPGLKSTQDSSLHGSLGSTSQREALALRDKVDYFFYYDLTRLAFYSLLNHNDSNVLQDNLAQEDHQASIDGEARQEAGSVTKTSSSSFDRVSASRTSFCSIAFNSEKDSRSNLQNSDPFFPGSPFGSVNSVIDLKHVLFEESLNFHGKYGEFVITSDSDRSEVAQTDKASYQDMRMEISRIVYVKDMRKKLKLASWFYSEPTGMIISRAYDQEDDKPSQETENAATEAPAEAAPAESAKEDTAEPKAEEEANEGEDNRFDESACKVYGGMLKGIAPDELVFIVYHHPPFVFIDSTVLHVNASMEQLYPAMKNQIAYDQFPPERQEKYATQPSVSQDNEDEGDQKKDTDITIYYSGFLIDLLEKIKERYPDAVGAPFPKYRIVMSRLFGPPKEKKEGGDGDSNYWASGGFGSRAMAKAGAGGKENEVKKDAGDDDDGGDATKAIKADFRGMIQEVKCQKQKIALMPMTPTPERKLKVHFSEPFFDTVSLSIMMKKPILLYHYWKFVTVLEYSVWICITGAYFFTSILLWFFDRSSPYSYRNDPERYKHDVEKRYFTLKESLWFCITSLTPQGGGEAPKALSGRLVAATWWLFGFIVIASYTANLAAFLTVSRLDHPINNFDELTRQYKVKYAPFEGSSTRTYFERMARIEEKFYQVWKDLSLNDDLEEDERAKLAVWDYPISDRFTKIWAAMTEASSHVGFNEAVWKVKQSQNDSREGNALVAETPVIDYAIKVHCDLMKIGGEFNPRPNALAYNKENSVAKNFDKIIAGLKDDGTIQKLKDYWWYDNVPKRECYEHRKLYNGLTLKNSGGIFMVVSVGIMATLVALWIENWYYDMRTEQDMKKAKTGDLISPNDAVIRKKVVPKGSRCLVQ